MTSIERRRQAIINRRKKLVKQRGTIELKPFGQILEPEQIQFSHYRDKYTRDSWVKYGFYYHKGRKEYLKDERPEDC